MPARATCLILVILLAAVAVPARLVGANGGTIQLSNSPAGPYSVTVYTSPTPIRTGTVDISVMVQEAGSSGVVNDARVVVEARPVGRDGGAAGYPATHEQATNKLFYAANVALPTDGRWRIGVHVAGDAGEGDVAFEIDVTSPSLLDSPPILLLVATLPAVLALAWLGTRRKKGG